MNEGSEWIFRQIAQKSVDIDKENGYYYKVP